MNKQNKYEMIKNGLINIINHEQQLNKMNYFPVADNDTGTNLKLSLVNLVELINKKKYNELGNDILNNSCGNSGFIFGTFLLCVFNEIEKNTNFLQIFELASNKAHNSVSDVKNNTILTIMNIFSLEFTSLEQLELNLINLKNKNENYIKKHNQKFDSGIKAFLYFIEGLNFYLQNKILKFENKESINVDFLNFEDFNINYRFCIQVITNTNLDFKKMFLQFEYEYDSLVILENQNHYSIHIHSDKINEVFDFYDKHLNILKTKVQDMKMDVDLKNKKSDVLIVYDSIADFSSNKNCKINTYCLYLPININNVTYYDRLNFSNDILIKKMKQNIKISSSQPKSQDIINILNKAKMYSYKEIIFISVSKQMSGTYQKIEYEMEKFQKLNPNLRIKILNSKLNSGAQALYINKIINHNMKNYQETNFEKIKTYVNVSDLELMYLSGRLKKQLYYVIKFLKLGAIVTIKKGKGEIKKPILKKSSAIKNLFKIIKKTRIKNVIISYTTNLKQAQNMQQILKKEKNIDSVIKQTSNIIAMFSGNDALCISYEED